VYKAKHMPLRNHEHLFEIAQLMPTDFAPHGERPLILNGVIQPDCSDDCRFFCRLEGGAGIDWGVCLSPQSPRSGRLTYQEFGCPKFVRRDSEDDDHVAGDEE
jgi:hypothetical protein